MTAGQAPAFTMQPGKWLRDKGIQGDATIRLASDRLEISGVSGGPLRISTAQIGRIATGWRSIKHSPFFPTRVWLQGSERPLILEARSPAYQWYALIIRGLAAPLAHAGGMKRWPRPARDLDEFNRRGAPMPRALGS